MESTASLQEEKKGRKKSLAIGALFLAVFSAVGGAFLDRFSKAVVDKVFPPEVKYLG